LRAERSNRGTTQGRVGEERRTVKKKELLEKHGQPPTWKGASISTMDQFQSLKGVMLCGAFITLNGEIYGGFIQHTVDYYRGITGDGF